MGEALFGIASSLDAEDKTDPAADAYKDLIDHHPNGVWCRRPSSAWPEHL